MLARPIVAVTRDEGPRGAMAQALVRQGFEPFHVPAVRVEPPSDWRGVDEALSKLATFDWLVFTSRRAVEALLSRGWTPRVANGPRPRVAAVGPSTAAFLTLSGAPPDLIAEDAGAEGLASALRASGLKNASSVQHPGAGSLERRAVLWPRSDRARPGFAENLVRLGAQVVAPVAYRTVTVSEPKAQLLRGLLEERRLAAITFLSPSAAHGLAASFGDEGLGSLRGRTIVASIGPTTSAALAALGAPTDVEPERQTIDALAEALAAHLRMAEIQV